MIIYWGHCGRVANLLMMRVTRGNGPQEDGGWIKSFILQYLLLLDGCPGLLFIFLAFLIFLFLLMVFIFYTFHVIGLYLAFFNEIQLVKKKKRGNYFICCFLFFFFQSIYSLSLFFWKAFRVLMLQAYFLKHNIWLGRVFGCWFVVVVLNCYLCYALLIVVPSVTIMG